MVRDVPGQDFTDEKLPFHICEALIKQGAASYEGPRSISFRYEQHNGRWTGGYTVETSQQYRDLVIGRAAIDSRIVDALRKRWTDGVTRVGLLYGVHGWKEWGPKLKVSGVDAQLSDPTPDVLEPWNELVDRQSNGEGSRGRRHSASVRPMIDYAKLTSHQQPRSTPFRTMSARSRSTRRRSMVSSRCG